MNGAVQSIHLQHRNVIALQGYLGRVQSPRLAKFIGHLLSIHPSDRMLSRADFDPLKIPALLSGVVLTTVHREAGRTRFRIKVVGEDVVEASPVRPLVNRYLDEIVAELPNAGIIVDSRQTVLDTGIAYLRQGPPTLPFTFRMTVLEYVHCPLSADGRTIDHILSFFSYRGQEAELLPKVDSALTAGGG